MRLAKETARSIYVEASECGDDKERKAIANWASTSEQKERLTAMVTLAQSEPGIPISVETLDAQPWLFNCLNGTIDLRTGELREHRREDYLTKLCPIEYPTEPGDEPELWLEFLGRVFDHNSPLIAFVQRLVGMALVGEVLENILAIFHGNGANGKSVFVETICGVLGPDYAMFAQPTLLLVDRYGRHPTERADLFGKRLVVINETGEGNRLSESTVKQLTSRENIRARRVREDSWEFKPTHSLILATNHRPEVRGTDFGIWRRLRLVPFSVTIPKEEQDNHLSEKLKPEWPAILRWAVTGCLDWQRNGLAEPTEVLFATEAYRTEQDKLGEFITERCDIHPDHEARASDLYASYKTWATNRSEKPETQTAFGRRLSERGLKKDTPTSGPHRRKVVYSGIGLLPAGECQECQ
jgi:putative DNA primase/helicase